MSNSFQSAPPGFFVGTPGPRLYRMGSPMPEFEHFGSVPLQRPNQWDLNVSSMSNRSLPRSSHAQDKTPKGSSFLGLDPVSLRSPSSGSGRQKGVEQQRIERELDMLRELQGGRERDLQKLMEQEWLGDNETGVALNTAARLLQGGVPCTDAGFHSLQMICEMLGYGMVPLSERPGSSEFRMRKLEPRGPMAPSSPDMPSPYDPRKDVLLEVAADLLATLEDLKKLGLAVVARAADMLKADICTLHLPRGSLLVDAATGLAVPSAGILGRVATTGKVVSTPNPELHPNYDPRIDIAHVNAYICIAVLHDGAVQGVLRVVRQGFGLKRPFNTQDEETLMALAALVGPALHSAVELEARQTRALQAEEHFQRVRRLAGDALSCAALVDTIGEQAKAITGAQHCSVFLVEASKGTMVVYPGSSGPTSVPMALGIAGAVAQSGSPITLTNAHTDLRYSPQVDCPGVRPQTLLCLAVRHEEKVVSVLQLANKRGAGGFTPRDEELLLAYAELAGSIFFICRAFEGVQMQRNKAAMVLAMVRPMGVAELIPEKLVGLIVENARQLTGAETCCLFMMNNTSNGLQGVVGVDKRITLQLGNSIPGQVAATGFAINCGRACDHLSFNPAVDRDIGYDEQSIFCAPICADECVLAVVILLNKVGGRHFTAEDEDTFAVYANFAGTALRNCRVHDSLKAAKRKNEVLVDVLSQLSQTNLRKVDEIIEKIITGAQDLLTAQRCSLFVVDKERNELYSRVASNTGGKEIRFRMSQGIAGEVARTQLPLNIKNAYTDPRFNSDIDKQLAFKTNSILAYPVVREGETVAVAQLVNKLGPDGLEVEGGFTKEDEEVMEYFALFAGITLANAKMLEFAVASSSNAMRLMGHLHGSERRRKSYDAQLGSQGYAGPGHNHDYKHALATVIPLADVQTLQNLQVSPEEMAAVKTYEFNIHKYKVDELRPRLFPMIISLLDHYGCIDQLGVDRTILYRFLIRVQLLYRSVPYHNWFHAADVVQTMFLFLNSLEPSGVFTVLDKYILLLASVLHDVDHMGLNNSFYLKTETPMGILVNSTGSISVLEVHHCNLSIEVMKDAATNAFHSLTKDQQTYAFKALVNIILATDMARHGEISKAFRELPKLEVDPDVEEHKIQFMQMLMKSCDVSNVMKPFEVARVWAVAVTEEFYSQGDMEKERGFDIQPMFDRQRADLAKGQIGFIDYLAAHQFNAMIEWWPGFEWTREGYQRNRDTWQKIIDAESKEKEMRAKQAAEGPAANTANLLALPKEAGPKG